MRKADLVGVSEPSNAANNQLKDTAGQTPSPPVPTPAADKSGLSALLEWSKPYREIIGILLAVIVAVSGGVAWIVSHFATQVELHYLECRVTNTIANPLLPVHMEAFAGKIEWRQTQAKELAQHGGGTQASIAAIGDLLDQAAALQKEQTDTVAKLQKDLDEHVKKCISETPPAETETR